MIVDTAGAHMQAMHRACRGRDPRAARPACARRTHAARRPRAAGGRLDLAPRGSCRDPLLGTEPRARAGQKRRNASRRSGRSARMIGRRSACGLLLLALLVAAAMVVPSEAKKCAGIRSPASSRCCWPRCVVPCLRAKLFSHAVGGARQSDPATPTCTGAKRTSLRSMQLSYPTTAP